MQASATRPASAATAAGSPPAATGLYHLRCLDLRQPWTGRAASSAAPPPVFVGGRDGAPPSRATGGGHVTAPSATGPGKTLVWTSEDASRLVSVTEFSMLSAEPPCTVAYETCAGVLAVASSAGGVVGLLTSAGDAVLVSQDAIVVETVSDGVQTCACWGVDCAWFGTSSGRVVAARWAPGAMQAARPAVSDLVDDSLVSRLLKGWSQACSVLALCAVGDGHLALAVYGDGRLRVWDAARRRGEAALLDGAQAAQQLQAVVVSPTNSPAEFVLQSHAVGALPRVDLVRMESRGGDALVLKLAAHVLHDAARKELKSFLARGAIVVEDKVGGGGGGGRRGLLAEKTMLLTRELRSC
jgi:hypothetical protein